MKPKIIPAMSDCNKKQKEILFPKKLNKGAETNSLNPGPLGWLTAFGVAALTFIVYLPALNNKFVNWDDITYITGNLHIQALNSHFFKWIFSFYAGNWDPLTWVSHALDYSIWGLDPFGHHLSSVVIHSANSFLLCLLFIYLVMTTQQTPNTATERETYKRAIITGGVAATLFGIIPVHVESVAWVSERKDVLSTFFFVLCLIPYSLYSAGADNSKRRIYYFMTLVFFVLSLMSKPMAITLPFILVLLDIYPLQRLKFDKNLKLNIYIFLEKIPFIILSLGAGVLTFMAQHAGGAVGSVKDYPIPARFFIALKALILYLIKMVFPVGLSPFYPYQKKMSSISFLSIELLMPLAAVILISIGCIYAWGKKQRFFLIAWAYYLITLLPVLGIIKIGNQAAADRFTYIPSISPLLLIGLGVALISEILTRKTSSFIKSKAVVFIPLTFFIVFMCVLTVKQIGVWKDSVTLWTAAIENFPTLPFAYNQRGVAYMLSGKYNDALKDLDYSITLKNDDTEVYMNRAFVYKEIGDYQNSLNDLNRAVQLSPKMADLFYRRAAVYIRTENYQKAFEDLNSFFGLAQDIDTADAFYSRAFVYIRLGDYRKAIEDLSSFIDKAGAGKIKKSKAYLDRAAAHMKLGNYQQAVIDYTKALSIDPKEVRAYYYRGTIYNDQGEFRKAIADFSEVVKLTPDNHEAYNRRAKAYLKTGDKNEAARDFKQAAKLAPTKK